MTAVATNEIAAAKERIEDLRREVAKIYFHDSSTTLSDHDLTVLRAVYQIQQQGGGRIRLVGQSLDRANAVAHALLDMGAPPSAVAIAGDTAPAQGQTTGAEAADRRVDIFLDR